MAEKALFFTTGSTGDGATSYTQTELFDWLSRLTTVDKTKQGVIAGGANLSLDISGGFPSSGTTVNVLQGGAYVYGIPYKSDATVSIGTPTPVVGTTGYRIVLRANYSAQTVRLVLLSSADGTPAIPALTQTANTTWEISLYTFQKTTGGTFLNWTDTRIFLYPDGFWRHNSVGSFSLSGNIETPMLQYFGSQTAPAGFTVVTFPTAFSVIPLVLIGNVQTSGVVSALTLQTNQFTISNGGGSSAIVNWLAIGPA